MTAMRAMPAAQRCLAVAVVAAVCLPLACVALPSDPAVLTLLDASAASCNDGTPAGYYVRRSNSSTVWNVYLQGGGFCFDAATCKGRPKGLTSSENWPDAKVLDQGLLGVDVNLVYVPYCTSDLYSGTREASNETYNGFSFLGSRVVPAVLDSLREELAAASQVLFSGSSAGGVGVFTNAQYMRQNWASVSKAPLRMLPDAGWFLNSSDYVAGRVPLWVVVEGAVDAWQSRLDTDCVADNPTLPSRCVMGQYLYPHVGFPTFVFKAQDDAWTVNYHHLPTSGPWTAPETAYLESLARNTTQSFVTAGVNTVFSPGCVVHTMMQNNQWSTLAVGGTTLEQAVLEWWKGGTPHLVDTCVGPGCNPTCP